MDPIAIHHTGSKRVGASLVKLAIDTFGPPIRVEYGDQSTYFMEFETALSSATISSKKTEKPSVWSYTFTVNPEAVSDTTWTSLKLFLLESTELSK